MTFSQRCLDSIVRTVNVAMAIVMAISHVEDLNLSQRGLLDLAFARSDSILLGLLEGGAMVKEQGRNW